MADEMTVRRQKLSRLRAAGVNPYPERYETSHTLAAARSAPDGTAVRVSGRLVAYRSFGKLTFGVLADRSGRCQVSFEKNVLPDDVLANVSDLVDLGDFLGCAGEMWTTRKGERTIRVRDLTFLGKALRPLPEKWHGLADPEIRFRKRYLDLLMNEKARETFRIRSRVISFVRRYLEEAGFVEVETPILQAAASGAAARPFVTHHHALDIDLYLRISPETYLKRLVAGGIDRVFEIGRNFRNEGIDPSHLQEFTMLEWYAAYWNYRDNMRFVKDLIQAAVREVTGGTAIQWKGARIEFAGEWPEHDYCRSIRDACGVDLRAHPTRAALAAAIERAGIALPAGDYPSWAALADTLYKKVLRPTLVDPCFVTGHPTELVPLARRNDADPGILDMFQVLVASWEIVKAYSELVDPQDQLARMQEQVRMREAGDEETMMLELDYIECMEHGMPPISGLGLGIDRFVALLADAETLREVVFFPAMRPEEPGSEAPAPPAGEGSPAP